MQELDQFLASVEKRAFRMAQMATHSEADALDIVQDSMIKLAKKYADKPSNEWRPLFFKILENKILDWHRKETLKKKIFFWQDRQTNEEERSTQFEPEDPNLDPAQQLGTEQLGQAFLESIEALPLKQQQCFMLRSWEGLSVEETANVMGINPNSVKSHYFRATQKLKTIYDQHDTYDIYTS